MILLQENLFPFRDNKAKRQLLVDAFRRDVEEADPEVLTGEPCASLTLSIPEYHLQNLLMPWCLAEPETIIFPHAFMYSRSSKGQLKF